MTVSPHTLLRLHHRVVQAVEVVVLQREPHVQHLLRQHHRLHQTAQRRTAYTQTEHIPADDHTNQQQQPTQTNKNNSQRSPPRSMTFTTTLRAHDDPDNTRPALRTCSPSIECSPDVSTRCPRAPTHTRASSTATSQRPAPDCEAALTNRILDSPDDTWHTRRTQSTHTTAQCQDSHAASPRHSIRYKKTCFA